jgi:hypothetical protein
MAVLALGAVIRTGQTRSSSIVAAQRTEGVALLFDIEQPRGTEVGAGGGAGGTPAGVAIVVRGGGEAGQALVAVLAVAGVAALEAQAAEAGDVIPGELAVRAVALEPVEGEGMAELALLAGKPVRAGQAVLQAGLAGGQPRLVGRQRAHADAHPQHPVAVAGQAVGVPEGAGVAGGRAGRTGVLAVLVVPQLALARPVRQLPVEGRLAAGALGGLGHAVQAADLAHHAGVTPAQLEVVRDAQAGGGRQGAQLCGLAAGAAGRCPRAGQTPDVAGKAHAHRRAIDIGGQAVAAGAD